MNNIFAILKWDAQRNLNLLRKPVDKDKWATEPAVVNAFYNPNKNDIGTDTLGKLKMVKIILIKTFSI